MKQTNLRKYNVEHNHQDPKVLEKSLKSSFKIKKYKNTTLYYQGSYELDFLEKYYDKFLNIERGPSIKYKFNGENKVYHPDFYIPSLNLIVEIKNSYLYERYKLQLNAKEKATVTNNFNYVIIVNKSYKEFIDKYLH